MKKPKKEAPKVKRRGLPVKPLPNLDKVNLLSDLGGGLVPKVTDTLDKLKPGALSPKRLQQMPSVATTETIDQAAIARAGEAATVLLANEKFSKLIGAMIGFRQAYALCYRELQGYVEQVQATWPEGPQPFPMVEDFLVQYAAYQAGKPFTEHTLMDGFMQTILPWMADIIDAHSKQDEHTDRKDRMDAEAERRKLPIAIGCKHTPHTEEATLTRERSLVLVGWRNAVLWVVDQICDYNNQLNPTGRNDAFPAMIVRFMEKASKVKEQSNRLIRIGGTAWKNCADSDKRLALCMGEYVADKLSGQVDLLVCDNLAAAIGEGFIGRPDAARAGDSHKRFRKWCDNAGAAFIGCVCRDDRAEVDIMDPMFEQLRTFTHLREVVVTEEGEEYQVTLGNHATVWKVKKEVLDGYDSRLVLPTHTIES